MFVRKKSGNKLLLKNANGVNNFDIQRFAASNPLTVVSDLLKGLGKDIANDSANIKNVGFARDLINSGTEILDSVVNIIKAVKNNNFSDTFFEALRTISNVLDGGQTILEKIKALEKTIPVFGLAASMSKLSISIENVQKNATGKIDQDKVDDAVTDFIDFIGETVKVLLFFVPDGPIADVLELTIVPIVIDLFTSGCKTHYLRSVGSSDNVAATFSEEFLASGNLVSTIISFFKKDAPSLEYTSDGLIKITNDDGSFILISDTPNKKYELPNENIRLSNYAYGVTISGGNGNDTIYSNPNSDENATPKGNSIIGGSGNDFIVIEEDNSTIHGNAGVDRLVAMGKKNKIYGDAGDDIIYLEEGANNNSIKGGLGDDLIIVENTKNILIEYVEGDGNDIIVGYDESDTIKIDGEYNVTTKDNDFIISVGEEKITVIGAAGKGVRINDKVLVVGETQESGISFPVFPSVWYEGVNMRKGTTGNDMINNAISNVIIYALAGNDSVNNYIENVTVDAAVGSDIIKNFGDNVKISGGTDNDSIQNNGGNATIDGGSGDDQIINYGNKLKMGFGTSGNDFISAVSDGIVFTGDGNDSVGVYGAKNASIVCGADKNVIYFPFDEGRYGISSVTLIDFDPQKDILYFPDWAFFYEVYYFRAKVKDGNLILQDGLGWYTLIFQGVTSTDAIGMTYVRKWNEYNGRLDWILYNRVVSEFDETNNLNFEVPESSTVVDNNTNTGNMLLIGGGGNDTIQNYSDNVTINSDEGNDSIGNFRNSVTIDGGIGNDSIHNTGSSVSVDSGSGDDYVYNYGKSVTIDAGMGNDSIANESNTVKINGGMGDDSITNTGYYVYIRGDAGDDYIFNTSGQNVTIDSGEGNDDIVNYRDSVTIDSGADNDFIYNAGSKVTINGGDGDDSINNRNEYVIIGSDDGNDSIENACSNVTINGGAGNDSIYNYSGKYVTINGSNGNDFIYNNGYDATLEGGGGNDLISISGYNYINTKVNYVNGDGNDTIYGFNYDDTLQITGATYTTTESSNDLIIGVGNGSILIKNCIYPFILGTLSGGGDTTPADTLPVGISISNSILTASSSFTGNKINLADYNATSVNVATVSQAVSIVGNAANNSLRGGISNDTISGGIGNDTLTGGNGKDIFIYESGNDVIMDYTANEDKIKFASGTITSAAISGSDVILNTDNGSITIKNGKNKNISVIDSTGKETSQIYPVEQSKTLNGTSNDDNLQNTVAGCTINGLAGNDSINNESSGGYVVINGGAGSDHIIN